MDCLLLCPSLCNEKLALYTNFVFAAAGSASAFQARPWKQNLLRKISDTPAHAEPMSQLPGVELHTLSTCCICQPKAIGRQTSAALLSKSTSYAEVPQLSRPWPKIRSDGILGCTSTKCGRGWLRGDSLALSEPAPPCCTSAANLLQNEGCWSSFACFGASTRCGTCEPRKLPDRSTQFCSPARRL